MALGQPLDTCATDMQCHEQGWICLVAYLIRIVIASEARRSRFQQWSESEIASSCSRLAMTNNFRYPQLEKVGRNNIAPNDGIICFTYGAMPFRYCPTPAINLKGYQYDEWANRVGALKN